MAAAGHPWRAVLGVLAIVLAPAYWPRPARADDAASAIPAAPATPGTRPSMRQLDPSDGLDSPPSSRDLVDVRPDLQRRFREMLSHTGTAAGARLAAETLLNESIAESDRAMKWLMLEEARRLGEAAGQATIVSRAIGLAAASYDFDAIQVELRCLKQIPLRVLDAGRAAGLASAADAVATRAEADGRPQEAVAATLLAYRAWQRAGNTSAARQAAARHDALLRGQ